MNRTTLETPNSPAMRGPLAPFTDHPASVGESYGQHLVHALGFAGAMLVGALACAVHAVFPFLCVQTGSATIVGLHRRMVTHRDRRA